MKSLKVLYAYNKGSCNYLSENCRSLQLSTAQFRKGFCWFFCSISTLLKWLEYGGITTMVIGHLPSLRFGSLCFGAHYSLGLDCASASSSLSSLTLRHPLCSTDALRLPEKEVPSIRKMYGHDFFRCLKKLTKTLLLPLLLYLLSFPVAQAQLTYKADLLNYKSGLFADEILDLEEDHIGNLYLSTNVGLYKYNGHIFNLLRPDSSSTDFFPDTKMEHSAYFSRFQKLLCSSAKGIHTFDIKQKEFKTVIGPPDVSHYTDTYKFLSKVSDTSAYFLDYNYYNSSFQLFKIILTVDGSQWEEIPLEIAGNKIPLKDFRRFFFAGHPFQTKKVVFFADRDIYHIDTYTNEIEWVQQVQVAADDFDGANQIIDFAPLENGTFLLSIVNYGLCIYHPADHSIVPFVTNFVVGETIFSLGKGSGDTYWLGSNIGNLYSLNIQTKNLQKVNLSKVDISDDFIKAIYESNDGKLYISCGHGLYKVDLSVNIFKQFNWQINGKATNNFLIKNGILHPLLPIYIFDSYQSDTLWSADLVSGKLQSLGTFQKEGRDLILYATYQGDKILANLGTTNLVIDENGILSPFKINKNTQKLLEEDYEQPEYFDTDEKASIYWAGKTWVCIQFVDGSAQCFYFNPVDKKIEKILYHEHKLFLYTKETLYRLDRENQKLKPLHWNPSLRGAIEIVHVSIIDQDWIVATQSNGIYKGNLNVDTLYLERVCQNCNNQIGQRITAGFVGPFHQLWYTTNTGVLFYNPTVNTYMEYSYNFNLSQNRLYRPFFCNQNGICAISTISTLDWTTIVDLFPKDTSSQLSLSKLYVNEKLTIDFLRSDSLAIYLPFDQNSLNIQWSHYNALHPDFYQFAYKMDGWDEEWQLDINSFNAVYQNLPPGKYTFRVRAYQNIYPEFQQIDSFSFEIRPPFWETWWFQLFVVLFISLLVYLYVKQKVDGIQKQAEIQSKYEKQLNELKMNSLRMQMNPHFMFNSLNSIKNYILKNEKEIAARYLSNFAFLIRSVLNFSEEKLVPLKSELSVLKTYIELEQLRFSRGFSYEIRLSEKVNEEEILVQPLLLQPFVENAIWHGLMQKEGNRKLQIDIDILNHQLIYQIEDNGIGRTRSTELKTKSAGRKSFGIQITKARMDSMSEHSSIEIIDLFDNNNNPSGTKIIIKMPILTEAS